MDIAYERFIRALNNCKKFERNLTQVLLLSKVYEKMIAEGLGISQSTAEKIKQLYGSTIQSSLSEALNTLSAGNLVPTPVERLLRNQVTIR